MNVRSFLHDNDIKASLTRFDLEILILLCVSWGFDINDVCSRQEIWSPHSLILIKKNIELIVFNLVLITKQHGFNGYTLLLELEHLTLSWLAHQCEFDTWVDSQLHRYVYNDLFLVFIIYNVNLARWREVYFIASYWHLVIAKWDRVQVDFPLQVSGELPLSELVFLFLEALSDSTFPVAKIAYLINFLNHFPCFFYWCHDL